MKTKIFVFCVIFLPIISMFEGFLCMLIWNAVAPGVWEALAPHGTMAPVATIWVMWPIALVSELLSLYLCRLLNS